MRADKASQAPVRGSYTVGEIAAFGAAAGATHIVIACNRCERRGRLSLARMVAEHGADKPGPELLRDLSADCPKRISKMAHDICGIHTPQMARWVGVAFPDDPAA